MIDRVITLLYHDVIDGGNYDSSGFGGSNPAEYKITSEVFDAHLDAIKSALKGPVINVFDLVERSDSEPPVVFTFDDGGVSSYEHIAPALEKHGWRGCFFVTTDRIGEPSFLNHKQIEELHRRGHAIGSHSCSHPVKMSACSRERMMHEWKDSLAILSEIVGRSVTVASIPGGFYSREIAETALSSGVQMLFTSEPIQRIQWVGDCMIIGRFGVKRGMGSSIPAQFVAGDKLRRLRTYAYWNLKKSAKALVGPLYTSLRTCLLARR